MAITNTENNASDRVSTLRDASKESEDLSQELVCYDFLELSKKYPCLKPYLSTTTVNSTNNEDSESVITKQSSHFKFSIEGQFQLFKVILRDQFNFKLNDDDYVVGKLVPTIPSRSAYIGMIKKVLDESNSAFPKSEGAIKGLDIGCGTYAIYCVLGKLLYGCDMVGIDIDEESIKHAKMILERNGVGIELIGNDGLIGLQGSYGFVCCNPPFYESFAEIEDNTKMKRTMLRRDTVVGSKNELIYENGGEIGFITKLIDESFTNDMSIWYSSLICKKRSIRDIIGKLMSKTCQNWFVKSMKIGNSKKWVIFWSWRYFRPIVEYNDTFKNTITTIVEFRINLSAIEKELAKNKFIQIINHNDYIELTTQYGDVWSRSFRRRQRTDLELLKRDKYVFKVTSNYVHWQYGRSPKVFQSFHTLLRKHMMNI